MRIGLDLVSIPRAAKLLENREAIARIFHPEEMTDDVERLAGRIALKEAYMKATGTKMDWLMIRIRQDGTRPIIDGATVSVTHEGEYAAAVVILE